MQQDIISGRNPVLEALKAGRPINRLLLASEGGRHSIIAQILYIAKTRGIPVEYTSRSILDKISATHAHQGIIAYTAAKEYATVDELLAIPQTKDEAAFFLILDGIEDPHNLGAIVRTAEAAGAHGIIIRSRRAVGLTTGVAKAAAGALEYIQIARVANISQLLARLKKENIWIVGIEASANLQFNQVDFKLPVGIVIGSEGKGISRQVLQNCDFVVSIPMRGKINSLNASVAGAIVMYEVLRQRNYHK